MKIKKSDTSDTSASFYKTTDIQDNTDIIHIKISTIMKFKKTDTSASFYKTTDFRDNTDVNHERKRNTCAKLINPR